MIYNFIKKNINDLCSSMIYDYEKRERKKYINIYRVDLRKFRWYMLVCYYKYRWWKKLLFFDIFLLDLFSYK